MFRLAADLASITTSGLTLTGLNVVHKQIMATFLTDISLHRTPYLLSKRQIVRSKQGLKQMLNM